MVQAQVPGITAGSDRGGSRGPAGEQGPPGPIGGLVVPSGLDEQPPGVGVAGLRDRTQGPRAPGGVLRWRQSEEARNRPKTPLSSLLELADVWWDNLGASATEYEGARSLWSGCLMASGRYL